jgi:uncharacterized protein YhaN
MRIERLDLRAFGCFSCFPLQFDPVEHGLHFVYGDNEAGKSTALRAIECWLYGFEKKEFDFLHDASDLRVGGIVSHAERRVSCMRKRGTKNTLLRDDETPFPHDPLAEFLQGIDRKRFRGIFGINHDQLVAGGKEIAEGHGDLGSALFASAAGLVGLQKLRAKIEVAKKDLYSPTGRKVINKALSTYDEAKKRIKIESISAKDYEELATRLAQKAGSVRELRDEQVRLQAEKQRWLSINHARPIADRLAGLRQKLALWTSVPRLAIDFSTRYQFAIGRKATVDSLAEAVRAEVSELQGEIAAIPNLNPVLEWEDRIEKVYQWSTTQADRREERTGAGQKAKDASGEAQQALRKLGYIDVANFEDYVEKLRVDELTRTKIGRHGNQYEKLLAARDDAVREHADKLQALTELGTSLAELPNARKTDVLSALLDRFNTDGNPEKASAELEAEVSRLTTQLATDLEKLGMSIHVDEVISACVPNKDAIEIARQHLDDAERDVANAEKRLTDLRQAMIERDRDIANLRGGEQIPDVGGLERSRAQRETGWIMIKRAWLDSDPVTDDIAAYTGRDGTAQELARMYEGHVAGSDSVADRLRLEATRVADLNRLQNDLTASSQKQTEAESAIQRERVKLADVQKAWTLLWSPIGIKPKTPTEMRSWLDAWNSVLLQAEQRRQKVTTLSLHKIKIDEENRVVRRVLGDLEEVPAQSVEVGRLADLLTLGRGCLQSEQLRQNERGRLESDRTRVAGEVKTLGVKLERTSKDWAQWQSKWHGLMSEIDRPRDTTPDEADDVLKFIAEYQKQMKYRREQLQVEGRLLKEEEAQLAEVRFLAEKTGELIDGDVNVPISLIAEWKRLLKRAVNERTLKTEKGQLLKKKQDALAEHNAELAGLRQNLDLLRIQAGVQADEELPARIEEARARDEAEKALRDHEKEMNELAGVESCEKFLSDVKLYRDQDLEEKVAQLDRRLAELADLIPQRANEEGESRKDLQLLQSKRGSLDAKADMEASVAVLRDRCPDYVALFLAEEVLKLAITRFAEKSKTDVFGIASDRFRQLTCGSFERLEIADDEGTPILVGRRPAAAGGKSVRVSGMSDGSCDQLYLALRLAHLQKHVEREGPFPFIVDDILITFDNDRALAALTCLCDISARTQVFFFSHHRHLLELAKDNLSSDRVVYHELGAKT